VTKGVLGDDPASGRAPSACQPSAVDAETEAHASALRIVYCGGCNPHIDRGAVASELAAAPSFARRGATVYLSGCQRACASDHQLSNDDQAAAVVAGTHVDGAPTPAEDIAASVRRKLKE